MSIAVASPGPTVGPLSGYTVGVTADRRAVEQIELLERRGAVVLHAPTIRTDPLGDEAPLRWATQSLVADPPEIVVALTALGLRSWIEAAESFELADELLDTLARSELWVRGPKARGAATAAGLEVHGAAPLTAAELGDALLARGVKGTRIAVQLDGAGNAELLGQLRRAGAEVLAVPVYRWSLPEDLEPAERLVKGVVEGRVDAVTFTTQTAIVHLVTIARRLGLADELVARFARTTTAACVGPVCAERARSIGLSNVIEPRRARIGSMVRELARVFEGKSRRITAAGVSLELRGRLATVDGSSVLLTDRERDVLVALVEAGGRVVSKRELLREIWGTPTGDAHVIEVTVGRLRQRLPEAGRLIQTVHRRGYRLVR